MTYTPTDSLRRSAAISFMSSASWRRRSGCNARDVVTELNHTVLEALDGMQIQWHVAVTSRDQRNTVPNEHRDHTDHELVDRALVEKGADETTAAHQPHILAGLLSKTAHERTDRLAHELDA